MADRVEDYGAVVKQRLEPDFKRIGADWPPERMVLVGLKQEKTLEVWVGHPLRLLRSYPILGASGGPGPKLREGDRQVPEGLYRVESLNPNSRYHLALRLDYPNAYDREMGQCDGRDNLGGDIMIHGNTCSIGCLAMGDEAAEDLFILASLTGIDNIMMILSPVDFRVRELPDTMPAAPEWIVELYEVIRKELNKLVKSE